MEVSRTRTLAADPAAVWATLADFGALAAWADDVDHCCLINGDTHADRVGLARRVQIGRDTVVETIVDFAAPRTLAYRITGVPAGFSVSNRWTVQPRTDGTTAVTLTSTIRMSAALLRPLGERAFARLMARRVESLLDSLTTATEGKP
ncbi:SRPBCC family protein [Mycolicibacterium sp.]|uniref:SRPBCC family protein n=1 Tax=Mycolicibacterium sp. TaxID=2320850 RepID=UPI003D0C3A97